MPARLTSPTVGRRPTMPCWADGLTIEPEVSVPIVTAARPGGGRRARAGARAAGAEVEVVRVQDLAAERAVAVGHAVGHEVRELGQVRLADDHGAGRAQLGDDGRVTVRDRVLQRHGAGRRRQARDVEVVLHEDGDAVQRSAQLPGRAFEVEQRRVGERARVHDSDGVEPRSARVDGGDPVDVRARQLHARQLARGHLRLQLGDRGPLQIGQRGDGRRRPGQQQTDQQAGRTDEPHVGTPPSPLGRPQLNSEARCAVNRAGVQMSQRARWG